MRVLGFVVAGAAAAGVVSASSSCGHITGENDPEVPRLVVPQLVAVWIGAPGPANFSMLLHR